MKLEIGNQGDWKLGKLGKKQETNDEPIIETNNVENRS